MIDSCVYLFVFYFNCYEDTNKLFDLNRLLVAKDSSQNYSMIFKGKGTFIKHAYSALTLTLKFGLVIYLKTMMILELWHMIS